MRKNFLTVFIILSAVLAVVTGCQAGTEPAPTSPSPLTDQSGTPAKLAFITQPGDAVAGSPLSTQPVVVIQDDSGNVVTSSIMPVKLTITSGTGSSGAGLFGPSTVNAVDGEVRFQNLSVNKAGTGYTLTASSGDLTPAVSTPFNISPGAPAKLAFTVQPSDGTAGSPLATQPEVTVQDRFGNQVAGYEGEVTLSITTGTGPRTAALSGTVTVPMVDSLARFTDIQVNTSTRDYTLTATSGTLEQAESAPFTIEHTTPTKLEFTVQPSEAVAGRPFGGQPKVAIEDIYGNVALSARDSITVAITPGTGVAGAVLSGTLTLVAEGGLGGLAEFEDLAIDLAGSGYTLTATSGNLTPATSQPFDVAVR